ncbi:MAG: branched-chain amino acid ABC transporter permease [Acholeplasmataceae bacterium]|nr:branched-chain amino acid ABC transporter permease [Acholeplasmataceae bacterium]
MSLSLFLGTLFNALYQASLLALVTLAITLIFKTSFTTNFAQGSIGTFTSFFATIFNLNVLSKVFPNMDSIMLIILAMTSGFIIGFMIGLFIDIILIRKAKFSNILTKQMITMGMVLVLTGLVATLYKDYLTPAPSVPAFFNTQQAFRFMVDGKEVSFLYQRILTIGISITIIGIIFALLKFTKWGLGVRATASNEKVASMMGVNTRFITAMSWGIASAIGSIAAFLYAVDQTLNTGLMVFMQVNGFLAGVMGGFATFFGPVVGAILIPVANAFAQRYFGIWSMVFIYVLVLVVVLIRPTGLFGKKVAKKV